MVIFSRRWSMTQVIKKKKKREWGREAFNKGSRKTGIKSTVF